MIPKLAYAIVVVLAALSVVFIADNAGTDVSPIHLDAL